MATISVNKSRKSRRMFQEVYDLLEDSEHSSKIYLYMSKKTAGDDYDDYEKNYIDTLMNPLIIKGYVRELSPEALVWKQYGLANVGAKEILCRKQYRSYFENCAKIVVDDVEYQVFKEGTGNRTIISERPKEIIRVVITRKE